MGTKLTGTKLRFVVSFVKASGELREPERQKGSYPLAPALHSAVTEETLLVMPVCTFQNTLL